MAEGVSASSAESANERMCPVMTPQQIAKLRTFFPDLRNFDAIIADTQLSAEDSLILEYVIDSWLNLAVAKVLCHPLFATQDNP